MILTVLRLLRAPSPPRFAYQGDLLICDDNRNVQMQGTMALEFVVFMLRAILRTVRHGVTVQYREVACNNTSV